jgi:hypothetical protein
MEDKIEFGEFYDKKYIRGEYISECYNKQWDFKDGGEGDEYDSKVYKGYSTRGVCGFDRELQDK